MSECDFQNIKKTIGDGLLITSVGGKAAVIFFDPRVVGVEQQGALLTSTSLIYLMSLPL